MMALPLPSETTATLEAFRAYDVAVLGASAQTVRNHGIYLRAYLRWWLDHRPGVEIRQATANDVTAFLVAEAERRIGARTRRAELAAIRRFHSWLLVRGDSTHNPAALVPSPKAPPLHTEVYTAEEIRAILTHTGTLTDVRGRQRHALVSTLRYTGMRSKELRTLRRADLDLSGGRARVVGKGDGERIVLLPPVLVTVLEAFLAEVRPRLPDSPLLLANAHPFVTTALHGYGNEALAAEVKLAAHGAGVPGRHYPHRWRHTYATELIRAGVDIHVVQRLLGHRHITSTVGYTHLVLDDLREAVAGVWDETRTPGTSRTESPASAPSAVGGGTEPAPRTRPAFTT